MPYLPHVRPDHDETLIARLAVGDVDPREAIAARALVADCPACAELLGDLTLIASATTALPPPTRTRDFRLTDADAARLRPAGWRGLVARFGSPSLAFTRPLAGGLAALGIAGLILASIPAGLGGSASSAALASPAGPAFDTTGGAVEAAGQAGAQGAKAAPTAAPLAVASAAASAAALAPALGPETAPNDGAGASVPPPAPAGATTTSPRTGAGNVSPVAGGVPGPASANPAGAPSAESLATGRDAVGSTSGGGPTPLVVLSVILLVVGLVLGGLRLVAGRLG